MLNGTFARIDDSIAGFVAIAVSGDYILASANSNASPDEARRAHLKFTGTPAANFAVTIPAVSKSYWIWNATGKTATITTGSGGAAMVEAGDRLPVWCDGANVSSIGFGSYNLKDYIAAQALASSTALPGQVGNAGKYLKTDGANATWQAPAATDLSDYTVNIIGRQIALAVSL